MGVCRKCGHGCHGLLRYSAGEGGRTSGAALTQSRLNRFNIGTIVAKAGPYYICRMARGQLDGQGAVHASILERPHDELRVMLEECKTIV